MSEVPLVDVEELFADPVFSGASISTDGSRLAYLAPQGGRSNVWIRGIDDGHEKAVCVTRDSRRGIKSYYWTGDPRWLLYLQDTDGNEDWHLYRVDLEDPDTAAVDLTPMGPGSRVFSVQPMTSAPGHVVVMMNQRPLYFDAFLIEVATGVTTLHRENNDMTGVYLFAANGEPVFACLGDDGAWEFSAVDEVTGDLRLFHRQGGPEYPLAVMPAHVTHDGTGLLVGDHLDGDELKLVHVDLRTGAQKVIAEVPGHSLCTASSVAPGMPATLLTHSGTGALLAARFVGERPLIEVLDDDFRQVYDDLVGLSDGVLASLSCDREGRLWVVTFTHDRDPGVTYLYDRSTRTSRLLFRPYPQLDPSRMASMTAVTIAARDGLPLQAFLTLPVGVEPAGLPLVLKVHGGPWFHDVWGYDREVQFLANRGYAVLQVNFRGSTGYGRAHITAAIAEFAGKMHDDLIDAANWAVEQGLADSNRLGIYGGSYGGYAALVGVAFTPDFFAAAVDYVGMSDLVNFMRNTPAFTQAFKVGGFHLYAGDPDDPEQEQDLRARSPITRIDQIRTPLLVVQGANDVRVIQAEADNVVASLRARGVHVEYLLAPDEGHGFVKPENLIAMFNAIERHFAEHLGGRTAS